MTRSAIYLDHVLIAVRRLSAAADLYSSLGFKVTPEGRHPGRGTHNRLVVFGTEYLELIAVPRRSRDAVSSQHDVVLGDARGAVHVRIGDE